MLVRRREDTLQDMPHSVKKLQREKLTDKVQLCSFKEDSAAYGVCHL
jgi:hypothetical protein